MELYHTALLKGSITFDNVRPTSFAELPNGIIMQNDFIKNGLPQQFDGCDLLYAEPPWPHGLKVFNKRAGVNDFPYEKLVNAFNQLLQFTDKPVYLFVGSQMLKQLIQPKQVFDTKLNGGDGLMAVWNDSYDGSHESTVAICKNLGKRYNIIGEFMAGYGASVKSFLRGGGKKFVAADFDGKCVTVMASQIGRFNENLSKK
jgi:hypothetical protein